MDPNRLRGSLPALVTPLTPDRQVHEDDLEALIGLAIADGASGVLVAGSTGEGSLLEPDQRVQLTRRARAATDATVVAGASGATVEALDADVERLVEAGADLVLVLAPNTYLLSPEELRDLHLGVAERTTAATLLYHIPQLTGSALTAEAVRELADHPRIGGMKDSSPDAGRRRDFIEVTRDVEGFEVLTGHAPTLLAALEDGASGSITALANLRQRQIVALHAAVQDGDTAEASRLQAALSRFAESLVAVGSSMPATLKAALQLDGVVTERWCRPPLRSVPPGRLDHVRTALMR